MTQAPYFSPEYRAFMESKEWEQLKELRKALDGYTCQTCGDRSKLQVHHKYAGSPLYRHQVPLGDEDPLKNLITLCADCHDAITQSVRQRREQAKQVRKKGASHE